MKKAVLALCVIAVSCFSGCDGGQAPAVRETTHILEIGSPTETVPDRQPETCAFSDGLDRFIECYNSCRRAYGNADPLKDTGWDYRSGCWRYKQFEDIWTEPELQVYVEDSGAIREIRIGYEDHGYTEWGEALSDERAFFTLRCLCDDESDEDLRRLIGEEKTRMKETAYIAEPGEAPEVIAPRTWGDYRLYQFFSGGVYYFCIRESGPED